jgi:hypothetical protein
LTEWSEEELVALVAEHELVAPKSGSADQPAQGWSEPGELAGGDEGAERPAGRAAGFGVDQADCPQARMIDHGVAGDHAMRNDPL